MFRNQSSTKKSINCGASAGLAHKFGIPALASKVTTMLSSLIGGIGALFYMIFFSVFKQAKQHLCSLVVHTEHTYINNINSDSYIIRLEESAQFFTNTNVPVEQKRSGNQNKKQIKFVNEDLFFCVLLSMMGKLDLQKAIIREIVERIKVNMQRKWKISSTNKIMASNLKSFPIIVQQLNKLKITEPAFL